MSAARVWVTRARPGADTTADRLWRMGFHPVVAPLLEVRVIDGGEIDLAGVGALAFTSANGVAAFAARSPARGLPALAVGAATAAAARAAGFAAVTSAEGDVEALARLIAARAPFPGDVLHAAAREPAGDLAAALAGLGVPAREVAVYESVTLTPDAAILGRISSLAAVLLHSPRAARGLVACLADRQAPGLVAACLSEAVAAPVKNLALSAVRVAATPTEAALLDLLRR